LLFSKNFINGTIIKINNFKSVNNILLISKNNLKYIDFKNNSFFDDTLLHNGVVDLEVQNENICFVNSFDKLLKLDYQYLNDNNFTYFTPGPVFIRPEIKNIVGNFINHHRSLATPFLYKEMAKNILWAFNSTKGFPIAINSPGTAGLESCMVNLLEPGDKVLFLSNGFFGRNLINVSKRYHLDATYVDLPDGHEFDLNEVENLVKDKKALFFVHMDTSCGILNPIKEIANICNKYNVLLVVDSISTILNEEFNFDDWNITAAVCASTKGFEVSPGLSFVCVSQKGMEISKNLKVAKTSFLDWHVFANKHISNGFMPYTTPVSIVAAVNAASEYIKKMGGIKKLNAHKKEMGNYLVSELEKLGFSSVIPNPNSRSVWVNTVRTPFGIKASEIRSYLYVINNTLVETGILDESDSILRIGISINHSWEDVNKLINDIKKFLSYKEK
ncbi:MAG: aminotransferase class V-fold PLP-dependent enzyme, partial [Malacoplasma sp.]|nr:aminotransferase class V-fold PLP-dependent enzyme [Malacoplasma sp.]